MNKKIIWLFTVIVILTLAGCRNKIEYIDDEHVFGEWIDEVKKTCHSDGILGHYHCSHCDKYFDEFFNELPSIEDKTTGHNLVFNREILATGWSLGSKAYYECSRCGNIYADEN